ncbi:FecR/PupR family sigma factor regulator [Azotobacter salinestris]|uniref:FecR/PupR family sigma factor regulator n=1 Tax=Azotobacter salinestris TaxID=69964 RepID=UPI001266BBA3|nr:DUF4880 domain-containing protein [Azotobacter salinestris]
MNGPLPPAPGTSPAEEAAYWCMRLHEDDCSEDERQAFQRWLDASPEHAREFAAMLEIWELSADLPPAFGPRAAAPARPRRHSCLRRMGLAAGLAALVLLPAGYGGWRMGWIPGSYIQGLIHDLAHPLSAHVHH